VGCVFGLAATLMYYRSINSMCGRGSQWRSIENF
jgi:hypothetical protein